MVQSSPTLYCVRCLTTFESDGDHCSNLGCACERPAAGWGRMFDTGDVIDRRYRVGRRLALGGAGIAYRVREIDDDGVEVGPQIALKLLFTSRDEGAYLRRLSTEAQILEGLDHPNIVKYLGFVHRRGESPYLLTRFESGGSLLDHMRRVGTLNVKTVAAVGQQVCSALQQAHAKGIVHRDLKPENMLLELPVERGEIPVIRVVDFGIAKVDGGLNTGMTRQGTFVGTPQYAAPEQFLGEAATVAADVYGLAAVLLFLMTARPVVKDAHLKTAEEVYLQLQDKLPVHVRRSKDSAVDCERMSTALASAMCIDPQKRCSIGQFEHLLSAIALDASEADWNEGTGGLPLVAQASDRTAIDEVELAQKTLASVTYMDDEQETVADTGEVDPAIWTASGVSRRWIPLVVVGLVLVASVVLMVWVGWNLRSDPSAEEVVVAPVPAVEEVAPVAEEPIEEKPPEVKLAPPVDWRSKPDEELRPIRRAVNTGFNAQMPLIRKACGVRAGRWIDADVVLEPDGRVRSVQPKKAALQTEIGCIFDSLKGIKIRWRGSRPALVKTRFST